MSEVLRKHWSSQNDEGKLQLLNKLHTKSICLTATDIGVQPEILDAYAKRANLIPVYKTVVDRSGMRDWVHGVVGPLFIDGHQRRNFSFPTTVKNAAFG